MLNLKQHTLARTQNGTPAYNKHDSVQRGDQDSQCGGVRVERVAQRRQPGAANASSQIQVRVSHHDPVPVVPTSLHMSQPHAEPYALAFLGTHIDGN